MRIGIDFDNTIVSYDTIFHRVCSERGLIPATVPVNKSDVRNYLRKAGREEDWTEMQGVVYGRRLREAEAFPGALEFFSAARAAGAELAIISHKTRQPFRGEPTDLHAAAWDWLEQNHFFEKPIDLPRTQVFFELTREAKLERIAAARCDWFVDDLPEFLSEPGFPASVRRVLFDPAGLYEDAAIYERVPSWAAVAKLILP
jgi:hypothetical protein